MLLNMVVCSWGAGDLHCCWQARRRGSDIGVGLAGMQSLQIAAKLGLAALTLCANAADMAASATAQASDSKGVAGAGGGNADRLGHEFLLAG